MTSIEWDALRAAAKEATAFSYVPYSRLQVGAAVLLDDGTIINGCNVENASIGLTFCAEITMIGKMHMAGYGRGHMIAVAATDQYARRLTPCGRCRQLLMEHGGPDLLVDGDPAPRPMRELLPDWFGPEDLPANVEATPANQTRTTSIERPATRAR
jgi:cytidine deaminase